MTAKCLSQKDMLLSFLFEMGGKSWENPGWGVLDREAAWHSPCTLCPPLCHVPCSVLSPVPKLPAQAPTPADPDSSSESDYEHDDFSAQPPVALTTFYSECLGPGAQRPCCLSQGEGPAAWGPSVGPT